jgi:hypothetical protein
MRNPTVYLKMRVLGAIDLAEGNSIAARIKAVSQMTFTDEEGHPRQFTWRTIQTWYSRFKKHGVTSMESKPRSDKGKVRKVLLEDLIQAIGQVLPKVHGQTPSRSRHRATQPFYAGPPAPQVTSSSRRALGQMLPSNSYAASFFITSNPSSSK